MSDYEYQAVRRRVREKKKYFRRVGFYVVLAVGLVAVNLFTYSGTLWFPWAIMGFGIDLLVKYFQVFGVPGIGPTGEEWEERELEKEIRRLEAGSSHNDELELRELEKPKHRNWNDDELV